MTFKVTDNSLGYGAIDLSCETNGSFTACQDVTVKCGTDGISCHCPVTYDQGVWSCNGQCGTSTCTATNSDSYTLPLLDIGAGLAILVVILIIVFFARKYLKKQPDQTLLDKTQRVNYTK